MSRSAHAQRLREVAAAQETEADGLRRERDALVKSLSEIDATFEASVKTLETQLLLLLRSKLDVEYRDRSELQQGEIEQLSARRNEQQQSLANVRANCAALKRQLEDQQTEHAAHVAASAREALASQRAETDAAIARLIASQKEELQRLESELAELRMQEEKAEVEHAQFLESLQRAHVKELEETRRTHEAMLTSEKSRRVAASAEQLEAFRLSREAELVELSRALEATDERCAVASKNVDFLRAELYTLMNEAPRKRAELEAQHRADITRFQTEAAIAAEARRQSERAQVDAAVGKAVADEKARNLAELEGKCFEDPELVSLRAEASRLNAELSRTMKRKEDAERAKENAIKELANAHGASIVSASLTTEDCDRQTHSAIGKNEVEDISSARTMALERTRELVAADKAATAEQLRADCAAYADALAALQRALAAERKAHGAQVRRLQAELDSKESELALLEAEEAAADGANPDAALTYNSQCSERAIKDAHTPNSIAPANGRAAFAVDQRAVTSLRTGMGLLEAKTVAGDDPVAAEWRRLVAEEKAKLMGGSGPQIRASSALVNSDGSTFEEIQPTASQVDSSSNSWNSAARETCVIEDQLQTLARQLDEPGLDPGIVSKLRQRQALLEAEIVGVLRSNSLE